MLNIFRLKVELKGKRRKSIEKERRGISSCLPSSRPWEGGWSCNPTDHISLELGREVVIMTNGVSKRTWNLMVWWEPPLHKM